MKNFRAILILALMSFAVFFALQNSHSAQSMSEARKIKFAENDILFYDSEGSDSDCTTRSSCNMQEITMEDLDAASMNSKERVKMLVNAYGPLSMDLQREYGIPWEVIYGMMIMESQVGADKKSVANGVYNDSGRYNFLGMSFSGKLKFNEGYKYTSNRDWTGYGSMSQMIIGYTIDYLRNGNTNYVAAIKSLEGSNYSLETYTKLMLKAYCPPSDCNSHDAYWRVVKGGIDAAQEVARANGWPTSEELFRQENIPSGGAFGSPSDDIRTEAFEKYGSCGLPGNTSSTTVASGNGNSSGLHAPSGDGWLSDLEGFENVGIGGLACDGCKKYTTPSGLPQFIVLHYTAGTNLPSYNSGGTSIAPHFTIDVKNRKTYQHIPITQTSGAVKTIQPGSYTSFDGDDASVQIEIIGVGYSNWRGVNPNDPYNLANFTEDEWGYLADLLIAIHQETGIPLQSSLTWGEEWSNGTKLLPEEEARNYVGVLGHMHIQHNKGDPGDIWGDVSAALAKKGYVDGMGGSCTGNGGVPTNFKEAVLAYAWPEYHAPPYTDMMPAYAQVIDDYKNKKNDLYVGGGSTPGIDCNGFVSVLMVNSGWDPNYNSRSASRDTSAQLTYLKDSANGWEKIKDPGEVTDTSTLLPGDVAIQHGGGTHHTFVYVGEIEGFENVWASASLGTRAPMASGSWENANKYYLFRKK